MITKIISAFPGTGKTFLFNNTEKKILDSDSSKFDKSKFPQNYIEHIKRNIGKVEIILVSSHKEVREALVENNIYFTLVYPKKDLKKEYIKRYKERDNLNSFVKLLSNNWDGWVKELQNQKGCDRYELSSGEYLSDYETINRINERRS